MTTDQKDDYETGVYQDPRYCCMDCGCEFFEVAEGLYDKCNSCGKYREEKRGPKDVR